VRAYLVRWCPMALDHADWLTCARVHHGGPHWYNKTANDYGERVVNSMRP
jgi:hypothetical protein